MKITQHAAPTIYAFAPAATGRRNTDSLSMDYLSTASAYAATAWTLNSTKNDPALAAHTPLVKTMLEAALLDLLGWFRGVTPNDVLDDPDIENTPRMNGSLLEMLRRATPSETTLLRNSLSNGDELWKWLQSLAPPALVPHVHQRTSTINHEVRVRVMHWLNQLRRDVGSAGPRFDAGQMPQGRDVRVSSSGHTATLVTRQLRQTAREIRKYGDYQSLGGEMAPFVLPRVRGWPAHRPLQIHDMQGRLLDSFQPPGGAHGEPVSIMLDPRGPHYSAWLNGRVVPIPGDGNCFYRAALVAMGRKDRGALLAALSTEGGPEFRRSNIAALRNAAANQLERNPAHFQPILEMLTLAHGSSLRR